MKDEEELYVSTFPNSLFTQQMTDNSPETKNRAQLLKPTVR